MQPDALAELLSPAYMMKRILIVHRFVNAHIRVMADEAFKTYWVETASGRKPLTAVHLMAERRFMHGVMRHFGAEALRVVGEESLDEADLTAETKVCILTDMIDGTDLLQRGFGNWCSAIVVFHPPTRQILGSYVAIPGECLYYATSDSPSAFRIPLRHKSDGSPKPMVLKNEKTLRNASMCLYAQKSSNLLKLLSLAKKPRLVRWLEENAEMDTEMKKSGKGEARFRFYNLAGNPMMARLAEGTVDVVFDIKGQHVHDVVPGAFIAAKAGASVVNHDGTPISEHDLAVALLRPGVTQLKYVVASNAQLSTELVGLLAEETPSVSG